jgi:hypothetical protein
VAGQPICSIPSSSRLTWLPLADVNDQGSIIRLADCGVVVAADSPDALARAMVRLARAPASELRRQGENSRRLAEERLGYASLRGQVETAYGRPLG